MNTYIIGFYDNPRVGGQLSIIGRKPITSNGTQHRKQTFNILQALKPPNDLP